MKDNITKELDVLAAIELSRTTPEVRYIFMEKVGLNFPLFLPTLMTSQLLCEINMNLLRLFEITRKSDTCPNNSGDSDNNI